MSQYITEPRFTSKDLNVALAKTYEKANASILKYFEDMFKDAKSGYGNKLIYNTYGREFTNELLISFLTDYFHKIGFHNTRVELKTGYNAPICVSWSLDDWIDYPGFKTPYYNSLYNLCKIHIEVLLSQGNKKVDLSFVFGRYFKDRMINDEIVAEISKVLLEDGFLLEITPKPEDTIWGVSAFVSPIQQVLHPPVPTGCSQTCSECGQSRFKIKKH